MSFIKKKCKLQNLFLVVFFLTIGAFGAHAQTISGQVTDENQNPLAGATVLVQGTTNGVITDVNGMYQIDAENGDVLLISYIGYETNSLTVGTDDTSLISLNLDSTSIDDVVVIGYGTRKKSHNTGAISQVGGEEVAAIQATRVDEALGGKLAGVLIQNQDGAPGADPKVQIRAASSITGDSNPLIVVDGYPISGNLSTVNPNDIESIEVLKDAASAAIYGSRGANGVILITTKKGKKGKAQLSYNGYMSTSHRYRNENKPISSEWANIVESEIANGVIDVSNLDPLWVNFQIDAMKNSPDVVAVEDWLFRNGNAMNHDFNISGGSENVTYFGSLGYLDATGIVQDQAFERYNARLNLDAKLNSRFTTGINVNGSFGNRDIAGWDFRDLQRAYSVHPIYHTQESIAFVQQLDQQRQALYDQTGSSWFANSFDSGYRGPGTNGINSSIYTLQPGDYAHDWHYGRVSSGGWDRMGNGIGGSGDAGPAAKLDNTERYQKTLFGNVSTYLQYEILDGLTAKTLLGADRRDVDSFYYRGLESDSRERLTATDYDESGFARSTVLSETTLNYAKLIGQHDFSAVAGYEIQNTFDKGVAFTATNIPQGALLNYASLGEFQTQQRDETIVRNSVFGRINYAYNDKYLASVSLRRDGDSRFGVNNKYETFPAFSLGWNVHNEGFWNSDLLTDLKLRVSRGTLGTTSFLDAYSSLSILSPQPTIFGTGLLLPSAVENPDLTWQTNTETNFGADFGFLNNRFTVGVDYYISDIQDILIDQSVTEVLGTPSLTLNSGDVESSGLEFEFGAGLMNKKNFSWDMSANLSTVSTEITDLGGLNELARSNYGQSGRAPMWRNYVGGEIGEIWGLETIGEVERIHLNNPIEFPNQVSGYSYVVDQNGDGEITFAPVEEGGDLVKIGQNTPDFYWGMNHQFSIKDFDVSMQFQGAHGGELYNIDPLYYGSQWGRELSDSFDANDDGYADHNNQLYHRNRDASDYNIQDASYVALRNLTLGYNVNSEWANNVGLGNVRVYAASTNLLYLMGDDYTGYNPEGVETTNSGYQGPTTYGLQVGASPIVRSFTAGLNVNF